MWTFEFEVVSVNLRGDACGLAGSLEVSLALPSRMLIFKSNLILIFVTFFLPLRGVVEMLAFIVFGVLIGVLLD